MDTQNVHTLMEFIELIKTALNGTCTVKVTVEIDRESGKQLTLPGIL